MLDRALEAPEVEEGAISYQSTLADRSLVSSPTIPPSRLIRSSESCTFNTPRVASRHSKRRRLYEESARSYEPSQAEGSVVDEIDTDRIEEESEHRLWEAHAEGLQTNTATECNKATEPNEAIEPNETTEPTKFGELNTEWDEHEQNRGIDVDEDPDCQRDKEDLPTIEDQ